MWCLSVRTIPLKVTWLQPSQKRAADIFRWHLNAKYPDGLSRRRYVWICTLMTWPSGEWRITLRTCRLMQNMHLNIIWTWKVPKRKTMSTLNTSIRHWMIHKNWPLKTRCPPRTFILFTDPSVQVKPGHSLNWYIRN